MGDRGPTCRTAAVAACAFASGLCALVYQTTWLREFRLVFGASTAASAAVLAIFMGGLGAGSWWFGRRIDRSTNPFRRYALLELGVAATAALSPALLGFARQAYVSLGGTPTLGVVVGSGSRIVLATLVLAAPTFLMGGTLPAAVRAVASAADSSRRRAALLYGVNTLGAVVGALLATFLLLETLGARATLWSACAMNAVVALCALAASRRTDETPTAAAPDDAVPTAPAAPRAFVLAAAAASGFAFFLMEIVWYRMLAPLLGGSTFTFGLILAVALLGIAVGSLAYSLVRGGRAATAGGFAVVCALEALFIALPYALGDRLMVLTAMLQPLGAPSLAARVAQWSVTTAIVVGPASILAGIQFPMLIALLGRGRGGVGEDTGRAYAWNTVGAIVGSLAGGFGLLAALGAPGAWKLVVELLALTAACALLIEARRRAPWTRMASGALAAVAALALLTATGPTAAWRHCPVGAGRMALTSPSPNLIRALIASRRRATLWEADGVESGVGLTNDGAFAFMVDGKSDGNSYGDAATQVMLGLTGALLHPDPKDALVVGLGTGSSAGWLGAVPSIERVDVLELEPAIRNVAAACAPVNCGVLENPKVHVWYGDAREAMLVDRRQYDVIASEPSNPYRAGVASLFTREFYEAADRKLRPHGLFVQWLQGYEVDGESVRGVYATLSSVFPAVETWRTAGCDLLFVASREPLVHDVAAPRERVKATPYREALAYAWRVSDVEGVFARFVADDEFATAAAAGASSIHTDDLNELEFAFARTVGRPTGFDLAALSRLAQEGKFDRPRLTGGDLDWVKVSDRRASSLVSDGQTDFESASPDESSRRRTAAKSAYAKGDFAGARAAWAGQTGEPGDLVELVLVAQCAAAAGDERAAGYAEALAAWLPHEAEAVMAQYHWAAGRPREALALAARALRTYHVDPWARRAVMSAALSIAQSVVERDDAPPAAARELMDFLVKPFAVGLLEDERLGARLALAQRIDAKSSTHLARDVIDEFGPHVPWTRNFLRARADAYRQAGDPRAASAAADFAAFEADEPHPFAIGAVERRTATSGPPTDALAPSVARARDK